MSWINVVMSMLFEGRAGSAVTKQLTIEKLVRVRGSDEVPWSVDLGWLYPVDTLPFGASGWVYTHRKTPFEARGTNGIVHTWSVLKPAMAVLPHAWTVVEVNETGAIPHSWNVLTEQGGQVPHLWRVIPPEIVAARSRDIQMPHATGVVTTGG